MATARSQVGGVCGPETPQANFCPAELSQLGRGFVPVEEITPADYSELMEIIGVTGAKLVVELMGSFPPLTGGEVLDLATLRQGTMP